MAQDALTAQAEIARLKFQLARYRRVEFGRSSEKLAREAEQLELALEKLRRQHGMAILAALALLDPQQHALGVDVADLERDDLGDAQSGAVGGSECSPVLRPR